MIRVNHILNKQEAAFFTSKIMKRSI